MVTSVATSQLPAGLLRDFLGYAAENWSKEVAPTDRPSAWEREIAERLSQQQLDVWTGFQAAGTRINLVAANGAAHVALLCDGIEERPPQPAEALATHRRLVRARWRVMRIAHRSWDADWFQCCDALARELRGP